MPKVSICLPVFNGECYLAQAIESVLAQSHQDWELLVSDDLSTDSSWEIIQFYASGDSRIVSRRNEQNVGLFANYNACLSKASGEYIKPFAQDDVLTPHCLSRMLTAFEEPNVKLVSCARHWIDENGNQIKPIQPFPASTTISGREVIMYNLAQLTNWVGEPSTVMFLASERGTGFDTGFYHYGDIEYWFRIVEHGNYRYLNENLCGFRRHSQSTTSKNHSGLYFALDILRIGKQYRSYSEALGESSEHFLRRALEVMALNVDHLVQREGLNVEGVRAATNKQTAGDEVTNDFRELSFHALRYITELIAQHDALQHRTAAEIDHLEKQLEEMRSSTSWRLTAPLRQVAGMRGKP